MRSEEASGPGLRDESGREPSRGSSRGVRRIVVLTAPSGAGKTTIAKRVIEAIPELRFSVSATTRPRRPNERDGVDYHFVDLDTFREYIRHGEMLEFEEVYPGRFYGTLRSEVERAADSGPILLDIDVRGALNIKRLYGDDALVIFIRPPSEEELERRLRSRATEDDETIRIRLQRARLELEHAGKCDVVIENDQLETAVAETLAAIRQFLGD